MDSHGPQEPRFDIFELTQTLQGVLESHFKFDRKFNFLKLFCKPQQYWYPWTSPGSQQPGINIFELPQTLRGILGSHFKFGGKFNFFCGFTKPNNMNVFGPPWTSATKIWLFRADSGPLEDRRVPFQILGEINPFNFFAHPNNVSAWGRWPEEPISTLSMDSPGPQQPKLNIYELTGPSEGPRVPFQIKQEFEFIISFKKPFNMGDY